ncbi:sensor histidine kinase [Terriglobus roseus]|uniref:sensor histidine kinase n=1 Tax=Terriglobus roseus TaxID=392734 RepID=UPI001FCDCE4C|nr:sensor histidine kinase [Terriglobus roseus]
MPPSQTRSHDSPTRLRLSEYQKQNWQVEDGLSESNVRQIAQGPDRKLLLATFSGVLTFDGQRFAPVSSVQNPTVVNGAAVNAMLPGQDGDLWVGTDGSGVLHQTKTGVVNVSEQAGFLHERIRTMVIDHTGMLWVATQNGIERFRDGRMERIPGTGTIAGDITVVFADSPGRNGRPGPILFITSSGLFRWNNETLQALALPKQFGSPTALFRDREGALWIGTDHALLQVLDESGNDPLVREVMATKSPVTQLVTDAGRNVWVGTRHDGLWRYSPPTGKLGAEVAHWGSHEGFEDETVRSLFIDDEDNLWIGMLTGGLSRWRKAPFAPYGRQEGLAVGYAAVAFGDSRGDVWLGSWGQGLFRKHGEVIVPMPLPEMQPSTPIRALTEGKPGEIWVGTWFDGIYRVTDRGKQHYRLGIESPVNAVSALLYSQEGELWIGTYTGIFRFASGEPGKGQSTRLLENKLITCLLRDQDGSVLVGTSEGLFRVRGETVTAIEGLPHPYVLSLSHDLAGNVWVGSRRGGIGQLRENRVEALHVGGDLGSLPIYSGLEDFDGHLWFGTSRGILRVSRAQMVRAIHHHGTVPDVVLFGKADGMRSSDCSGPSQPAATRMADGTLWFATTRGFVHTTAVAEDAGPRVAAASIEGWSPVASGEMEPLQSDDSLVLKPGQTDLRIFYDARELSNPGQIEFRYRLAGYDSEWTTTHSRVAHYQHLPSGRYRFEVQARKSGTDWISSSSSLSVRQMPHLYATWYFMVAALLLCGMAAVVWYRRRISRVRASLAVVVEERNRIARECHDTLMAGFAAVAWQVEATAKRLVDGTDPAAAVQSCELAHSMVLHCQAEARRIIWDLRDSQEVSGVLSHALSRAIDAHYREHSIHVELHVDGTELMLPPGSVHHLVCIGQEAISNALRHASPQRIDVQLVFSKGEVRLEVKDDGCGFQPGRITGKSGHFGMMVMEERARKLGGDFAVRSTPRGGTEIVVRVPFSTADARAVPQRNALSAAMW